MILVVLAVPALAWASDSGSAGAAGAAGGGLVGAMLLLVPRIISALRGSPPQVSGPPISVITERLQGNLDALREIVGEVKILTGAVQRLDVTVDQLQRQMVEVITRRECDLRCPARRRDDGA